jgi:hypothetical protein
MASAFDVGLPFLDSEISDFICAGRISAKIDKVCVGCTGGWHRTGGGQQAGDARSLKAAAPAQDPLVATWQGHAAGSVTHQGWSGLAAAS